MAELKDPIFPPPGHAKGFGYYNRQIFQTMFRRVRIHVWTPTIQTLSENIYGENLDGTWQSVYEAACYLAELKGWKQKLTSQGIDEDRPLLAAFNQDLLTQANNPFPKAGDLIEIVTGQDQSNPKADPNAPVVLGTSDYYKVMSENPTDYFGNLSTDRTYTWTVQVQRYRFESVSRAEVTQRQPDPLYKEVEDVEPD